MIRLLSARDDLVLDCFVGSGTTATAAVIEGRRYLGIDSDPRYAKMARDHLMQIIAANSMTLDPRSLTHDLDLLEQVEKATLRMVTQAIYDFRNEASEFFVHEH